MEPGRSSKFGARDLIIGTRRHVVRRGPARRAALDRDRPLPERARAAVDPRPDRHADRDARRGAERRRSASGASTCSAPFDAQHLQPFLGSVPRLDPDLRARRRQGRVDRLLGDARADDHDHPDHVVDLPRALHRRADASSRRAPSGSARRAGRWCKTVVVPSVRGGVVAAVILGLGRALGEAIAVTQVIGNFIAAQALDLRAGRHAREPDREPVPGRRLEHPGRVADLPRADPARDHVHHEPRRRSASSSASTFKRTGALMDAPISLQATGPRRAGGCSSTASPSSARSPPRSSAIAVLGDPRLVGVLPRRARAQLGLLHEGPGALRPDRRRRCARARRQPAARRRSRRRWRCRSAS